VTSAEDEDGAGVSSQSEVGESETLFPRSLIKITKDTLQRTYSSR